MKWIIQVELYPSSGGVTRYTATLEGRQRPPRADEVIFVQKVPVKLAIVRPLNFDTHQAIARFNVTTQEEFTKLKKALHDGGFTQLRGYRI